MSKILNLINVDSLNASRKIISKIKKYDVFSEISYKLDEENTDFVENELNSSDDTYIKKNNNKIEKNKTFLRNSYNDTQNNAKNDPSINETIQQNTMLNNEKKGDKELTHKKENIQNEENNKLTTSTNIEYISNNTNELIAENIDNLSLKNKYSEQKEDDMSYKNDKYINNKNNSFEQNDHISMVDFVSDDNFNSLDNVKNVYNINDIYDDLGKSFQDDLSSQYRQLDNKVNKSNDDIKHNYVSRRKIKYILLDKYGIDNDECVNELYSMAFNNKWKEIDIEHWLLNPNNMRKLLSILEPISNKPINNESKNKPNYCKFNTKNKNDKKIIPTPNFNPLDNFKNPNFYTNVFNIKDELKFVLIEENYKNLQFNYQTELLKNHLDSKLHPILNGMENLTNNYKNFKEIGENNFNKSTNPLSSKQIDEIIENKLSNFYNDQKNTIIDEFNLLKEKVNSNEEIIKNSLNFLRKEIKENENLINSNLKSSLDDFKNIITSNIDQYLNEITNNNVEIINNLLKDKFNHFNNIDEITKNIKDEFYDKIDLLSMDFNQFKGSLNEIEKISNEINKLKSSTNNNDLMIEIENIKKNLNNDINILKELTTNNPVIEQKITKLCESLPGEINNKISSLTKTIEEIKNNINYINDVSIHEIINTNNDLSERITSISNEFRNNIKDLYDEIDDMNDTFLTEEDFYKKEFLLKNNNHSTQESSNVKLIDKNILLRDKKDNKPNNIEFEKTNFDGINSFVEQKMDYDSYKKNTKNNDINFNYLNEISNNSIEKIDVEPFDYKYDTANLTKDDKSFYENFINNIDNNISNKIVSNFDANKNVNDLEIEKNINQNNIIDNLENNESKNKYDINEKFSKIDEIIKNSINELSDIKEYVQEEQTKIDDSIKMFEKV